MTDLKRLAVVTGAARGVGRAIAERLARDGFTVVVADIHLEAARQTALELAANGANTAAMHVDVGDEQSVQAFYADIDRQFGRLDVLVNNAGILGLVEGQRAKLVDMPLSSWNQTLAVNLTGTFLMCRGAVPLMARHQWGRIVSISSRSARARTNVSNAHYAASKAGVLGMSRVLAFEVGPLGITVNSVAPSRMATEMTATQDKEYFVAGSSDPVLGRIASIQDVAGSVAFLCSEDAGYLTGIVIDVNGGAYMP
jgi:3-oxoacyl-[acyl-carrier protein] reductase